MIKHSYQIYSNETPQTNMNFEVSSRMIRLNWECNTENGTSETATLYEWTEEAEEKKHNN